MALTGGQKGGITIGVLLIVGIVVVIVLWQLKVGAFGSSGSGSSKGGSSKKAGVKTSVPQSLFRSDVPLRPKAGTLAAAAAGGAAGIPEGPTQTDTFKQLQSDFARARAIQDASIVASRCAVPQTGTAPLDPELLAAVDQTGKLPKVMASVAGDALVHAMPSAGAPISLAAAFGDGADGDLQRWDPQAHAEVSAALEASKPGNFHMTDEEATAAKNKALLQAIQLESNPEASVDDILNATSVMVATHNQIRRAINMQSQLAMEAVPTQMPLRWLYSPPLGTPATPLPAANPLAAEFGPMTPGLENYLYEISCGQV